MRARRDALIRRLGIRHSIVAAPMAGAAGVDLTMFAASIGHGFCPIPFNEVDHAAIKS